MGDGYNFVQLKKHILPLSKAVDWETARNEWSLTEIYESDDLETCPCGHHPIVEICVIHNRITGKNTEVGNVCVKRFLGIRSDLIFSAIKKIRRDNTKALNAPAIALFHQHKILNGWEYSFYQDTMRLRILSEAQLAKRISINEKVIAAIKKRGFKGS
jgi:hypothetical protein